MKTYLDRLVSRAQAISAPLAVAPRPALAVGENPFETVAPPIVPLPPPAAPAPSRRQAEPAPASSSLNPPTQEPVPPAASFSPRVSPTPAQPSPSLTPPKPASLVPTGQTTIESRTSRPVSERAAEIERPVLSPKPSELSRILPRVSEPEPSTRPAAADSQEKLVPPPPAKTAGPVATPLPSPDSDRRRLQHAADSFMAKFSQRADAFLHQPSEAPEPTSLRATKSAPAPAMARLEPAASAVQPPPPPAAPSVVIGRVSVEVVPPIDSARSSAKPARATARSSAPRPSMTNRSSARFGLSQL